MATRIVDADWMRYIDAEVRAVCEEKGRGHQIRREWSDAIWTTEHYRGHGRPRQQRH